MNQTSEYNLINMIKRGGGWDEILGIFCRHTALLLIKKARACSGLNRISQLLLYRCCILMMQHKLYLPFLHAEIGLNLPVFDYNNPASTIDL